jgi:hypothetical protein
VSPHASWHRARHPLGRSSSVTTCLEASSTPPVGKGLRCHHVTRGTEPVTRQERAPESPRASQLQGRPCAERLKRHHVIEAPGPPLDRASVSPCVLWLQTRLLVLEGSGATTCPVALDPRMCSCVPKTLRIRLIMVSSGTRCRQRIKCICDRSYTVYD